MTASRRKKFTLGCLGLFVLMAAGFVLVARPLFFPRHYEVVSIRTLPEYQNPALLERAWQLPVAANYHDVLMYQPNGSVCGPTSVANAMRSLGQRDETPEQVLAGTGHCPLGFCFGGLALDQIAEIARGKMHRQVTVLRDLTLEQFRAEIAHANDPTRRYLLNFDRGPLFGTAGGHHSPIGGYLAARTWCSCST